MVQEAKKGIVNPVNWVLQLVFVRDRYMIFFNLWAVLFFNVIV